MRQTILAGLVLGVGLMLWVMPVQAQQVTRIRGTIASITGEAVEIAARDGSKVTAALAPNLTVSAVGYADIKDIKPDSYIGTAAVPEADGTLKALEVHVFDPSMRGAGEGFRPWDAPGVPSTMTNGTVGSVTGSTGRTLHVTYKGGEKDVVVPPDVPIVSVKPGARDLLVPGAKVIAFGTKSAEGKVIVERMSVGVNGIVPPM